MSLDPVSAALDLGGKLIDRLIPDPAQKSAAALELLKLQQSGDLARLTADTDLGKAQIAVNQAEATSASLFVAGGRPFVIWVCGLALGSDFIIRPLFLFGASALGWTGAVWPKLDVESLMPLLLGLLGLGVMRTYEKTRGG